MTDGHLTFEVFGHPEPAGSKKAFMRPGARFPVVVDDNPKSKGWKGVVAQSAAAAMLRERLPLIDGPVFVEMVFRRQRPKAHFTKKGLSAEGLRRTYPETKPDVLKLARAVEDACTGIVWTDDAQIVIERISKVWGSPEGVTVTVAELDASTGAAGHGAGFHVNVSLATCYMMDRPHSNPAGCPNCAGTASDCKYARGRPVCV